MLDICPKSAVFILEHCNRYLIEQLQGLEGKFTSINSGMVVNLKIPHARRN
jgi:hypothetical protein